VPGAGDFAVGVVVDTVREVLRVPETLVDPVPPILSAGADELEAVCRLDGGKRIVTILDAEGLLDFESLEKELEEALEDESMNVETSTTERVGDIEEQLVIFRLRDETYGVPVEVVQEIVRVPDDMTAVPRAPDFVEGIINLRGDVLPVIDQRRRFGLDAAERNDRQRIVVLNLREHRLGFIVDSVAEVRKIPGHVIGPAPTLSDAQARIIRRVANLDDRGLVLLLEPEQLVSTAEMDALGSF
ncbi:MAG: chemotaxis protein CheW, partial [Myxococcota bacterium]